MKRMSRCLAFLFPILFGVILIVPQAQDEGPFWISGIDVSPDGNFVAIGMGTMYPCGLAEDNYGIEIRNTSTNQVIRTLRGHDCPHYPVWSPSGTKIASSGPDGTVRIWDVATGSELALGSAIIGSGTGSLTWRSDETLLAGIVGGFYSVGLYDATTGEELLGFNTITAVYSVRWHPTNPNLIATAEEDGAIRIWNANGGLQEEFFVSNAIVNAVFWNNDGSQLLALSDSHILTVNAATGSIIHDISWPHQWYSLRFSNDSRLILAGDSEGLVSIWDAHSGLLIQEESHNLHYVTAVAAKLPSGEYQMFYGGVPQDATTNPIGTEEIIALYTIPSVSLRDSAGNLIAGFDTLENGDSIDLATVTVSPLSFQATTYPVSVGSVKFNLNGVEQVDDSTPYEFTNWTPAAGSYILTATPYSGVGGTGIAGTPLTINFSVIGEPPAPCSTTGNAVTSPNANPAQALTSVLIELQGIVDSNPNTPLADKIEDALAKAEEACNHLIAEDPDNQAALGNMEGAVGDIQAAVESGLLSAEQGNQLMDTITGIARQIATEAIDAALAQDPGASDLVAAHQSLTEGDTLRSAGRYKDAISKYKDALAKAESVLS